MSDDGSEVRFNHGLAVKEGRADVSVAISALKRAAKFATDAEAERQFMEVLGHLNKRRQYTEGHHPVRAYVSSDDVNHLHLAHMVAAENTPEWDDELRQQFVDNKQRLPTSA
jgi:hypothetical protein